MSKKLFILPIWRYFCSFSSYFGHLSMFFKEPLNCELKPLEILETLWESLFKRKRSTRRHKISFYNYKGLSYRVWLCILFDTELNQFLFFIFFAFQLEASTLNDNNFFDYLKWKDYFIKMILLMSVIMSLTVETVFPLLKQLFSC